jgi:hypothetical protein
MSEMMVHDLAAPTSKQAGEAKELHETRLGAAGSVLDTLAYVDDFNATVVDAMPSGTASSSALGTSP